MVEGRCCNGHVAAPPFVPNGVPHQTEGVRTVHDGFATIRAGGKRSRARSTPSVATSAASSETRAPKTCHGCCGGASPAVSPASGASPMEPLWEEKNGGPDVKISSTVARRDSKIPWWEVATRRSRYRSCPAFSQASIVSALEQTVSDVTDRLERLASSPDLKISEADELRRSAAILRRQSSAVSQSVSSGYFSLERQASCDSVSSVNSSVSNITYNSMGQSRLPSSALQSPVDNFTPNEDKNVKVQETSKIKKKSWLRSSFRRAFGKNNRDRKRSKLNESVPPSSSNWDSISTCSREASQQHYYSCHSLHRNRQALEPCKEHRNFHKDSSTNSEIVIRLQRLLQDKDRLLTENKLELSSAQKTIKSQLEVISRLQTETTCLKEENVRLATLVHNKFGSVSDNCLPPPPAVENVLPSISTSNGIYATLNISKGKKVKLCVIENTDLDCAKQAATKVLENPPEATFTVVGTLNIQPKTTWEELDDLVVEKCIEYCGRLDPGNSLGLGRESVLCYRVAEALRGHTVAKPDLLPYGYCVGNIQGIHMWLKGPLQKDSCNPHGNVSSISFQHAIPSSTLRGLLPLLHETRRVILVGPEACGKSSIANQLARCYVAAKGAVANSQSIVSFTVNGNNSLELCQLLASVASRSRILSGSQSSLANEEVSSSSPPQVLIINDLHTANGVVETIQRCLPSSGLKGPAIIATSQNAPILVTRLQVHCSFRWMGFSVQEEPIRGALSRLLRRPLLKAEISSGMSLPDVLKTVDWLGRLWQHLNSQLPPDRALGPLLLHDCPLDQEEAKTWFVLKWNRIIAPFLSDFITTDPKTWVLSTIPWSLDEDALLSISDAKCASTPRVPSSPSFSTVSTKRSFHKRFYETNFDSVKEKESFIPNGDFGSSSADRLFSVPDPPVLNGFNHIDDDEAAPDSDAPASSVSSEETIYAKPLLTNGVPPAVEKVIYTKPPPITNGKSPVLGSFSTFISNDGTRDTSRKYSIHSFTPVMYRREKMKETDLDLQFSQNGISDPLISNSVHSPLAF